MAVTLLDGIMTCAALGQVFNMYQLSRLQVPAIGVFVTMAFFVVAEVWLALEGRPAMWFWAAISVYSLIMATVAIHRKYFKGLINDA